MKTSGHSNHTEIVFVLLTCLFLSSAFMSSSLDKHNCIASNAKDTLILPLLRALSEEERDYISPMRERPKPKGGDVAYTNENIVRQQNYYTNIRNAGGVDCVMDIYARDPSTSGSSTRFWFVGKVARCTGTVSKEAAVARQYNLLEEHACRIRPVELGRCFGKLDLYSAPGDTELPNSQNDPTTRLLRMPRYCEGAESVPLLELGVNLEMVTNQGLGFFIIRTEDGVVPSDLIGQ